MRAKVGKNGLPLEEAIQDAILEWLHWNAPANGWKFWRSRPSQYVRKAGHLRTFKLDVSEIGMPDILGTAFGWTIAFEVKRPGAKGLSDDQELWRDDFLRCKRTKYYVVRSPEEVITELQALADTPQNPLHFGRHIT